MTENHTDFVEDLCSFRHLPSSIVLSRIEAFATGTGFATGGVVDRSEFCSVKARSMPLDPLKFRLPISAQIGVVAALFIAALVILWTTGASVVARSAAGRRPRGCSNKLAISSQQPGVRA